MPGNSRKCKHPGAYLLAPKSKTFPERVVCEACGALGELRREGEIQWLEKPH